MRTAHMRKTKYIVYAPMRYAVVLCRYWVFNCRSRATLSSERKSEEHNRSIKTRYGTAEQSMVNLDVYATSPLSRISCKWFGLNFRISASVIHRHIGTPGQAIICSTVSTKML